MQLPCLKSYPRDRQFARRGQSLAEVLVALAVGSIMLIAASSIILPAVRSNTAVTQIQTSAALGKELLDNSRVFAEGSWQNVSGLSTSSANPYYLVTGSSPFTVLPGQETTIVDVPGELAGYWKLEETVGTVAYDFSANNSTGTIAGGVTATSSCAIGRCLYFGGVNGYIDVPYNANLPINGDFTFSVWVKDSNVNAGAIVSQGDGTDYTAAYLIRYGGAGNTYFALGNGVSAAYAYFNPPVNAWHHVVATVQGTAMSLYLNGSLATSTTFSGSRQSPTTPLHLGRRSDGYYLTGYLDDVRIYSRALSANEVSSLYKGVVYTRYFYLDDVYRDNSGNVTTTVINYDPSAKRITAVFGWNGGPTSTSVSYLTRYFDRILVQSDWSGGSGQSGPVTIPNNQFVTSTNLSSTTRSLRIQGL